MTDVRLVHPWLEQLEEEVRAEVIECAEPERFESGAMLIRTGEPADRFFLIRTGTVRLEIPDPPGSPQTVQVLVEGDVLGWSWLFGEARWQWDAVAATATEAVVIDANCLLNRCDADPRLGYAIARRVARSMADRLHAVRRRLLEAKGY